MVPLFSYSLLLLILFSITQVASLLTTSVIDDNDPQVSYPVGNWIARSRTQPCTGCAGAQIDPSQAFRGTWHEESDSAEAEFSFFGTGVEIFAIVRHMPDNQSNYTFQIDGQTAGQFLFIGKGGNIWAYNTSVFARRNLPRAQHRMKIIEGTTSFMAFDWALIEDETPDPVSSTRPSSASTSILASSTTLPSSASTSVLASSTTLPSSTSSSRSLTPFRPDATTPSSSPPPTSTPPPASGPEANVETSKSPTFTGASQGQQNSSPPMGAIIGAAVGGAAVLALLIGLLWWWLRRKKVRKGNVNVVSSSPGQILPRTLERPGRARHSDPHTAGGADPMMVQARTGYNQFVPYHSPPVSQAAVLATDAGYPSRTPQEGFSRSLNSPYHSPYSPSTALDYHDATRQEYAQPSLVPYPSPPGDGSRQSSSPPTRQSSTNASKSVLLSSPQPMGTHNTIHEDGSRPPPVPPAQGTVATAEAPPPAYEKH